MAEQNSQLQSFMQGRIEVPALQNNQHWSELLRWKHRVESALEKLFQEVGRLPQVQTQHEAALWQLQCVLNQVAQVVAQQVHACTLVCGGLGWNESKVLEFGRGLRMLEQLVHQDKFDWVSAMDEVKASVFNLEQSDAGHVVQMNEQKKRIDDQVNALRSEMQQWTAEWSIHLTGRLDRLEARQNLVDPGLVGEPGSLGDLMAKQESLRTSHEFLAKQVK